MKIGLMMNATMIHYLNELYRLTKLKNLRIGIYGMQINFMELRRISNDFI